MNPNPLLGQCKTHPYYIVVPAYTRFSAGVKVLHMLADQLIKQGHQAFVHSAGLSTKFCAPPLTEDIVELHNQSNLNPIVIYPEIINGNPLNAGCVVRYLLNYPGKLGETVIFSDSDMLLWYTSLMRQNTAGKGDVLCLPYVDTTVFYPPPVGSRRSGSCFYAYKYQNFHGGQLLPITKDSLEIAGNNSVAITPDQVANLFRQSEVFYSYEGSGMVWESVLSGCPAVYLPSEHLKKNELILLDEMEWAGVSWGTDPIELQRARDTLREVPHRFEQLLSTFHKQLVSFIDTTQAAASKDSRTRRLTYVPPLFNHSQTSFEDGVLPVETPYFRQQVESSDLQLREVVRQVEKLNQQNQKLTRHLAKLEKKCRKNVDRYDKWKQLPWYKRIFRELRLK